VVAAVLAARAGLALARRGGRPDQRLRPWTVAYLFGWLLVPFLIAYLAFVVTGVARYHPRYWQYIVPPLAPLLVLVVDEAAGLFGRAWVRLRGSRVGGAGSVTVAALVVIPVLLLPGTLAGTHGAGAATDWRGTARDLVALVESDPDSRYVVFETSFSRRPYLDYYLSRYGDDLRVTETITRRQEGGREELPFDRLAPTIARHDYLVVVFIHHRTTNFPRTLTLLAETYHPHHAQVDRAGRGLVVFSVPPSGGPTTSSSKPD
jgi:hypothetical protein